MHPINFTGQAKPEHRLNINPQEFLDKYMQPGGYSGTRDQLMHSGVYKNMGWMYDFRPYLNRYVVEQYGRWQAYYHTSKTGLRRTLDGQRAVTGIVLVKAKSI